jgi:DNA-nicking Smr family endonuclease
MSKKKLTSLTGLKDLFPGESDSVAARARKLRKGIDVPAPAPARTREPEPEEDETDLFAQAMGGVERLASQGPERVAGPPPAQAPMPVDQEWEKAMEKFVAGDLDFELEFTEEYMSGCVRGLDPLVFQQLKAGKFSREAHVDLHGQNSAQAYENTLFFLREAYLQGLRCVLIVCGRGLNSPGGLSVLKRELQGWLTREPLRRVVLAFCTARAADGGAGALYVLLRRMRKDKGKVRFDTVRNWEEDS